MTRGATASAPADEAVIFADAAHPTHAVRPVGCWAPKEAPVAVEQGSGRDRLNIHGAIDLETGQTIMKDVLTVNALSTITLLMAIARLYPGMRLIHVFLDNARYHHAKLVQQWLARSGCRIKLQTLQLNGYGVRTYSVLGPAGELNLDRTLWAMRRAAAPLPHAGPEWRVVAAEPYSEPAGPAIGASHLL
jgi:DDE superfamily endonuclease